MGFFKSVGKAFSGIGKGAIAAINPVVGLATLASGGLDYFSANQQNRQSMQMAQDEREFSAEMARRQEVFQERMSNTAHQREVSDLKAAGLNPLLSLNQGASSPSGGTGSASQPPIVPELSNITSGAMDALRMYNEFRSSKAQSDLANANMKKAGVETDLLRKRGSEAELDERFYKFINGLLDRWGKSGSKSNRPDSRLRNWFDPNRNELDSFIEDPNSKIFR